MFFTAEARRTVVAKKSRDALELPGYGHGRELCYRSAGDHMGTTLVLRAIDAQRHIWGTAATSRITMDQGNSKDQQSWAGLRSWPRFAVCQPVPLGSSSCSYVSASMGARAS